MRKLHWLHVHYRTLFKVATLMYDVFHHRSPAYFHNLVTFTTSDSARTRLRSAVTVRMRMNLGSHALSIFGPTVWNSLPFELWLIDCCFTLRPWLKSQFFQLAFN